MDLKLDPPSGFADSYFDIEFLATFEKTPKSILTLYNDTSKEHLDIIGVTSGYIINGNQAIVKDSGQLRGHFNLFNDDKMNKKFSLYNSVQVRCKVEHFDENNNSLGFEEESLIFYNESLSLDAEIIPFNITIHNHEINLSNNEPLRFDIISGLPKNYVISIKSADDKSKCNLEISALQGRTSIEVPAALLAHDLDIKTHGRKKFNIYYIKHQGTNFSRLANRKYYKIDNTQISFKYNNGVEIEAQTRIDPCGRTYGDNFILSDRYLVLCPKEFSGFAKKNAFSPQKLMDLTMLVHEGQHMENLSKEIQKFSAQGDKSSEKVFDTAKKLQQTRYQNARKIRPRIASDQIQLMRSISGAYESIVTRSKRQPQQPLPKVEPFSTGASKVHQPQKKPCLPCARKRNQNA